MLKNALAEVKLAVDLIMLLEVNNVSIDTVLTALEMVRKDYEKKRATLQDDDKEG